MPTTSWLRASPFTYLVVTALTFSGGCTAKDSPPPSANHAISVVAPGGTAAAGPARNPADAAITAPSGMAVAKPILKLMVYQMMLPVGGVSRNDAFWKHVDEQRIDPATYDLLLKNGVRVGVAPVNDWDYFHDILTANQVTTHPGVAAANGSAGTQELTMKSKVPTEDVFYVNDKGDVIGRTYPQSENLLGISFEAEPRHPGQVRVSVSPIVRSLRSYWHASLLNDEYVVQEVRPEFLYDLNLRADIPPNHFLVIAPSAESKWSTSLGNTFFRVDGVGQQFEQVLILVPESGTRVEPTAAAR